MTENAELQQQLMRKEAELTRAEETIKREQQQVQDMQQQVSNCVGTCSVGQLENAESGNERKWKRKRERPLCAHAHPFSLIGNLYYHVQKTCVVPNFPGFNPATSVKCY